MIRPAMPDTFVSANIHLRPYQSSAVQEAWSQLSVARKLLIVAPCGAGKTTIAVALIREALQKGLRVLFVAHRRELVNQAYQRMISMGIEEREVGVIMAGDTRYRPGARVQVASIDTLRVRRRPAADVVIRDEAHRSLSRTDLELIAGYPSAYVIGLTATPFRSDGRGLGDAYDRMLVVASNSELIAEGHLVAPTVYTVPSHLLPDVSRVAIQRGDYTERALAEAVDKPALVGSIVEHALRHGRSTPTLLFAVNVDHSRHLVKELESAGIRAEHLDGSSSIAVRDAVLARLRTGETEVVSNCALFGEGLDIPQVKRVILARPTASTGLYLQQVGRVMRPFEGQQALVLDHAGSVMRHGLPQDDREFTLDASAMVTRRQREVARAARVCVQCYAVMSLSSRVCPACGVEARFEAPEQVEGDLIEVCEGSLTQKLAELTRLRRLARREGYHPGWVHERYEERFGESVPTGSMRTLWLPHTDAQRQNYLKTLMASESSAQWARVRYRVEVGQWANQQ